jgi:hypothetical protein
MRERVQFGGHLRIDGRPGKGTVLRAEIPLGELPAARGVDDPHPIADDHTIVRVVEAAAE